MHPFLPPPLVFCIIYRHVRYGLTKSTKAQEVEIDDVIFATDFRFRFCLLPLESQR